MKLTERIKKFFNNRHTKIITISSHVSVRKIRRNILRNEVGNKGLQYNWHNLQLTKYGKNTYNFLRQRNLPLKEQYNKRHQQLTF